MTTITQKTVFYMPAKLHNYLASFTLNHEGALFLAMTHSAMQTMAHNK